MTSTGSDPATCLGCGCACDDIQLTIAGGRIVEARHACPLGAAWFGDGRVPARVRLAGADAAPGEALEAAAALLAKAARPLVYLAPDLSCEAQREAIALADVLRGTVDSVTSSTATGSVLAAQELGRAGATLGEIRNRADVVVFWGVDPSARYPRYLTRYAPDPVGLHVADGRRSRRVVAVDIGEARGPADADVRIAIAPDREVAALTELRAAAVRPDGSSAHGELSALLVGGRYVAIVADAEPDDAQPARDPGRAAALIALAQALNGRTRCALSTLRAGGNRSGADACLTSQTGYPLAVDFTRGYPRYRPHDGGVQRLARGDVDAVLVLGSAALVPAVLHAIDDTPVVVIGPRASEAPLAAAAVVIDTGVPGIHEAGTAIRMDEVPLPLSAPLGGTLSAASMCRDLCARVRAIRQAPSMS